MSVINDEDRLRLLAEFEGEKAKIKSLEQAKARLNWRDHLEPAEEVVLRAIEKDLKEAVAKSGRIASQMM